MKTYCSIFVKKNYAYYNFFNNLRGARYQPESLIDIVLLRMIFRHDYFYCTWTEKDQHLNVTILMFITDAIQWRVAVSLTSNTQAPPSTIL